MIQKIEYNKTRSSCLDYYDKAHLDYFTEFSTELDKKPYDKDFLTRFTMMLNKNSSILDIGCCSSAQQARFFADRGFKVTAIDLSKACIETAKMNFPGIRFLRMDMLEMDFREKEFKAINAFYSIIHIPDEKLNGLFSDFNRFLVIGGKLAIAVHAGDFYGFYDENEFPVFYRTYSKKQLQELLEKHGFHINEIQQRKPVYEFEFQSERIYVIAKKIINLHHDTKTRP